MKVKTVLYLVLIIRLYLVLQICSHSKSHKDAIFFLLPFLSVEQAFKTSLISFKFITLYFFFFILVLLSTPGCWHYKKNT